MEAVNVSNLTIAGRVDVPDPKNGQVSIVKNLRFEIGRSYSLDFGSVNQGQIFGVVRSMFVDNSSNPAEIEVTVMGTDQYFTIPPYSEGYFNITARIGSQIILASEGSATDVVTTIFYNFDINPVVWYKYGAANKDIAQRTQGGVPAGGDIDSAKFPYPFLMAGRTPDGKARYVSLDANGALRIANLDVTIGAVFGPDAVGAAPTHPGLLMAALNSEGKIINLSLNAAGELATRDAGVNNKLDAIVESTAKGSNAIRSNKAASDASDVLLAANAERQGALFFNDSTAILYLGLGATPVTNTNYTVQVEAGGYYEMPAKYTGEVRGLWAAANGAARITEIV